MRFMDVSFILRLRANVVFISKRINLAGRVVGCSYCIGVLSNNVSNLNTVAMGRFI